MKRIIHVVILLILPVFFMILNLICKTSKGELYLSNQYDPSYVYLINSLNLSQLKDYGVGHFDHPGTTVQEIGALVIYFLHLTSDINKDIVSDVFNRPEIYLSSINLFFILMNSIALFILGFVSFKKLRDIYSAILLQLTPFFSITIYFWITGVSPEPLLIFTVLLLITIIISYISEKDLKTINIIKYVIGFGLICGFGLATKISFFPLLIIPFILIKRISFKVLLCLITLIAFLIFVLPAISENHSYKFLNWVKKLILLSGKYDTGEKNFIDFSNFLKNLNTIFTNEPVFCYSYILISITFLLQLIPKFKQKIKSNKYHKLLIGIFGAMTIQIFIVCKHFALSFDLHYLIPVYMLLILGLYTVNSIAKDLFPNLFKINKLFYLYIILIIFSFVQTKIFLRYIPYMSQQRNVSHNTMKYLEENYKESIIVSSYGVSSKEFALYLGALFGGSQKYNYYSILNNMFPKNYYYEKWSKNLENVEETNIMKNKLIDSNRFVFECDNEIVLNDFLKIIKEITNKQNVTFKKVFLNFRGETIYEIDLDPN